MNDNENATALISIRLWSGLTLLQNTYGSGVTVSNEDWARRKANTGKWKERYEWIPLKL